MKIRVLQPPSNEPSKIVKVEFIIAVAALQQPRNSNPTVRLCHHSRLKME
jgi:hypothetical protein